MSEIYEYKDNVTDALRVFESHVYSVRCAGGRIIAKGYVCPHCGSSDPGSDCGSPTPEFAKHLAKNKKRGRKLTTGKYETREQLEENVRFFATYQSESQVARTCGVSFSTVANILRPKS